MKTALVTGANKGIGFETARQLARQGFVVWLGCRDEARGAAAVADLAADGDVRFVRMDVSDTQSVKEAAAEVESKTGPLDVLVNNAGIALGAKDGQPSSVSLDSLREVFEVNFFGAWAVAQVFLPLVKKAKAGRIVNMSSNMGSLTALASPGSYLHALPLSAYASSKTAVNALTSWLAAELQDTSIKVNSVCPGYNATDLNDHAGTQHPSEGAKVVVRAATLDADGPTGAFFDINGPVAW